MILSASQYESSHECQANRTDRSARHFLITDMHSHFYDRQKPAEAARELVFRRQAGIRTVISTGTPREWEFLQEALQATLQAAPQTTLQEAPQAVHQKTPKAAHQTETQMAPQAVHQKTPKAAHQAVPQTAPMTTPRTVPQTAPIKTESCAKDCTTDIGKTLVSAASKMSAAGAGTAADLASFGIHPWYSAQWNPADYMDIYRRCSFIGEIGMDSLWCDVPLTVQRKVFEQQLAIAADLRKPVVLHTKDCEAEIAQIIRDFPGNVLVHWYSGDPQTLRQYLDLGCWFTLGPDTGIRKHSMLLEQVPLDRVFVETDGLESIYWILRDEDLASDTASMHTSAPSADSPSTDSFSADDLSMSVPHTDGLIPSGSLYAPIPQVLHTSCKYLADHHHLPFSVLLTRLQQNMDSFRSF